MHLDVGECKEGLSVAEEQRHILVERHHGLFAPAYAAGIIGRNLKHGITLLLHPRPAGFLLVGGITYHTESLGGVDGTYKFSALGCAGIVYYHDGAVLDGLGVIDYGIYQRIAERKRKEEEEHADVGEHQVGLTSPHSDEAL
ncbi:MAG: hypothetical protein K2L29_04805 [Duncaniella sp.]|nr:hypothetical protein [Duncaniella sp.]